METLIMQSGDHNEKAGLHFQDLLRAYCREFSNWSRYSGNAKHDPVLCRYMADLPFGLYIRFDFAAQGAAVFAPLLYSSVTGHHLFHKDVWERCSDNTIRSVSSERFMELTMQHALTLFPEWKLSEVYYLKEDLVETQEQDPEEPQMPAGASLSLKTLLEETECAVPEIVKLLSDRNLDLSGEEHAVLWFGKFINLVLPLWTRHFDKSMNLRDLVLGLDEQGFPVYAGLVQHSENIDVSCNGPAFFLTCFTKLIGILGCFNLGGERTLIANLYSCIKVYAGVKQHKGLLGLLEQRQIRLKGRLFGPQEYHYQYGNPLQEYFLSETVLSPKGAKAVFNRYFPKEDITVSIRPFNIDTDLERVHQWFHAEHAKPIWKMDWPLDALELFYRTLLAGDIAHSYIGEIDGVPTFNLEVYWTTRDILGDYYDVLPDDYGTHLFIAPTDKKKKFPSATMQTILDWLFAQPRIGRLVGEGAVESVAALMNKVHVGFRLERIIEMPHKRSHLNFCYREWYWAKFPENRTHGTLSQNYKTEHHESPASI